MSQSSINFSGQVHEYPGCYFDPTHPVPTTTMQPLAMSSKLSSCAALLIAAVHWAADAASIAPGPNDYNSYIMTHPDPTTTSFKLSLAQGADPNKSCINLDREGRTLAGFDKCNSLLTDFPLAVFTTLPVAGSANGAFLLHEMHYVYGNSAKCVEFDGQLPYPLTITDCNETNPMQHFAYDDISGRISLAGTNLCFAQTHKKDQYGEYWYLKVTDCEGLTDEQAQFVMVFDDVHIDPPEFE